MICFIRQAAKYWTNPGASLYHTQDLPSVCGSSFTGDRQTGDLRAGLTDDVEMSPCQQASQQQVREPGTTGSIPAAGPRCLTAPTTREWIPAREPWLSPLIGPP